MLVDPREDAVVVVDQADHARQAGVLAEHLAWDLVPEPRDPLVEATRHHDDGWIPYDRSPDLDPEGGLPVSFMNIPLEPYVGIWRRGFEAGFRRGPHVGLLVSLHGLRFFRDQADPRAGALVEETERRQREAMEALDVGGSLASPGEPVASQSAWLRFLDGVSLVSLEQWGTPWRHEVGGRTYTVADAGEATWSVDPWPFGEDEVVTEVEEARLPPGGWEDEGSLHGALASAERGAREVVFEPA